MTRRTLVLGAATILSNKAADIATAHVLMGALAEHTRRDESVNVLDCAIQHVGMPPPLWRAQVRQTAERAVRLCARGSIVPEEDVRLTDEPILVHRIQFDALAVFQDFGSADQRNIVKMNDVKTLSQNFLDSP